MNLLKKNIGKFKLDISLQEANIKKKDIDINENFSLIKKIDFESNRTLFLLIDIFSINYIIELLEELDEKSTIVLYYKDVEKLKVILSEEDFSYKKYNGKIYFAYGDIKNEKSKSRLTELLKKISINLTNIEPVIKSTDNIEYIRHSKELLRYIRNFKENYFFMLGNDLNDTLIGLRNRLINIQSYIKNPGINELIRKHKESFENRPAIIVSSGPSLNKNIKLLEPHKDEALILSCDGSLSTLLNNNIVPDIMGSVERAYRTYEAFYKDKKIDEQIVFAGPAVIRPEIINKFENKTLTFFKDRDTHGRWLNQITDNQKGLIWSGSSVAHMLMSIAHKLGCHPIILIGQDLSYSYEGLSHASETEILEKIDTKDAKVWLDGIDGKKVPSSMIWKQFLHTFEEIIREEKISVIDATEGGALIKGTEILSLQETIDRYFTGDKKKNLRELIENIQVSDSYKSKASKNIINEVQSKIDKFDNLLKNIHKAKKDNKKSKHYMIDELDSQEKLDSVYDCLEFVDQEIVKSIINEPFLLMLFQYPIVTSINKINSLKAKKYTFETILFNLDIHANLLDIIDTYSKKAIKVLIEGLCFIDKNSNLSDYRKFDFLDDCKYDIKLV